MKLPDVAPPGHQIYLKTRSFSMPTGAAPTILAGISHVGSQGLLASLGMGITSRSMPATSYKNDAAVHPLVKVHWFYLPPSCSKDGSPFVRGHLQGWFPNDLDLVWSEDNNCRLVCWSAMGEVQETQFDTGPVR